MDAIFGNIVLEGLLSKTLVYGLGVLVAVLVVLSISARGLQRKSVFCTNQAKPIKELKITDLRIKLLQRLESIWLEHNR